MLADGLCDVSVASGQASIYLVHYFMRSDSIYSSDHKFTAVIDLNAEYWFRFRLLSFHRTHSHTFATTKCNRRNLAAPHCWWWSVWHCCQSLAVPSVYRTMIQLNRPPTNCTWANGTFPCRYWTHCKPQRPVKVSSFHRTAHIMHCWWPISEPKVRRKRRSERHCDWIGRRTKPKWAKHTIWSTPNEKFGPKIRASNFIQSIKFTLPKKLKFGKSMWCFKVFHIVLINEFWLLLQNS